MFPKAKGIMSDDIIIRSLFFCSFYKNKGHSVETCYTRQHIFHNTATLTQSELSAMDSHSKSGPATSLSIAGL